jgi:L-ascorbate metabolism protein UlaG (beta-lactamase superfamily)
MNISWHGEGAVRIQSGDASLLLDPYSKDSGLAPLRAHVDIVALANGKKDRENMQHIKDPGLVIEGAGEFESHDIIVEGIETVFGGEPATTPVFYTVHAEGMNICHLGALSKELTDKQIDAIGNVDVLLLPVGGGDVLDAEKAVALSNELEPRIVIPIYYKADGVKTKRADEKAFLKEIGATDAAKEKTLSVKKHQLPQEETKVIVLEKN